jgi:glycosyltransferase involved in cell wall biosynthesis
MAVLERTATSRREIAPLLRQGAAAVAVLIPCYNEAGAIAAVVSRFRAALPHARIYVYDNNSSDGTAALARAAGAVVGHERLQGKGNVVARMFSDIDADIYVLVDGDDTYDPSAAPELIAHLLENRLDLVNGARLGAHARRGHRFGNAVFNRIVGWVFGARFDDMLSGYKVLSRRFVKSFPALANGFEIETELTVHALRLRMPVAELPTRYGSRPAGSASKLHTLRDGLRILRAILLLIKGERPLAFFSAGFALLAALSLVLAAPVAATYLETGLVPRLPTAVLATGTMLLAFSSLACGFILDTVTRGRTEIKRLFYLNLPAPGGTGER